MCHGSPFHWPGEGSWRLVAGVLLDFSISTLGIRITGLGHARSTLSKSGRVQIYSKWGRIRTLGSLGAQKYRIGAGSWQFHAYRVNQEPTPFELGLQHATTPTRKDTQRPDHPTIFTGLQSFGGRPEQGQPYISFGTPWMSSMSDRYVHGGTDLFCS
jgi:hypothetical protein